MEVEEDREEEEEEEEEEREEEEEEQEEEEEEEEFYNDELCLAEIRSVTLLKFSVFSNLRSRGPPSGSGRR